MGRARGVKSTTVTLALSDGDTILIRERLTAGQERDITSQSIRGYTQGSDGKTRVEPDPGRLTFVTAATYLLGWSLIDQDGKAIPWFPGTSLDERIAALRNLDVETLQEIDDAITKHRSAQQQAREGNATSEGSGAAQPSRSAA